MAKEAVALRFRVDWRRGPKHLRPLLDSLRHTFLMRVSREARRLAREHGLPSVANSIHMTASQVRIDHPAAGFLEFGVPPGHQPPGGALLDWLAKVGKTAQEEFPVARAIGERGLPARPFFVAAIEMALSRLDEEAQRIWGLEGDGGFDIWSVP